MKLIVLSSALIAILAMTGCTSKEPVVEEKKVETPVVEEVVVVDEAPAVQVIEVTSAKPSISDLEAEMKTVNFEFDKYNINVEMEPRVTANSELAKGDAADYKIKLEGNCDAWGSDEYNYALGLKRANSVKSAMVADGVAEDRITMISYGESNPVCSESTKECWKQNRRVEVKLLP